MGDCSSPVLHTAKPFSRLPHFGGPFGPAYDQVLSPAAAHNPAMPAKAAVKTTVKHLLAMPSMFAPPRRSTTAFPACSLSDFLSPADRSSVCRGLHDPLRGQRASRPWLRVAPARA